MGKFGFLANDRRAGNPLFLVIQLVIAKRGAALPHQARIERLAQVRELQMLSEVPPNNQLPLSSNKAQSCVTIFERAC